MIGFDLLTAIVFLPLLGAFFVPVFRRNPDHCRFLALGVTLADLILALSIPAFGLKSQPSGDWIMMTDHPWIETIGARYSLSLDGISLVLVLLTVFLGVLTTLVSRGANGRWAGGYYFCLLAMQTGVLGVFLSTDLFLFYLFWELQLIPMFFLIGMWGHEGRVRATIKFVLYSIAGSLLMLAAIIGIYAIHGSVTGHYTFSLFEIVRTPLRKDVEILLYAAFLLAFAVKVPIFPVHSWLPDAHTEAPTAGSVILAGLLLKTGSYAVLRFAFPLFPGAAAQSAPLLLALGLIGLFYASWIASAQKDMKRLVAYSSISHMGLIVLGIAIWNSISLSGAVLQMVNHGLTTSALFILVGILDERAHSRNLADFGGVWKKMPVFSGFFLFFAMASAGLPGLNNFVGEILIFMGTFQRYPVVAATALAGIVAILIYLLRLTQETLFGEPRTDARLWDITGQEAAVLIPLAVAVVWIGLFPGPILDLLQGPVQGLINTTNEVMSARAM